MTRSDIPSIPISPWAKASEHVTMSSFKCGISICKVVYIGWINLKSPTVYTGNYFQYPVINHNGKEYGKEYRYV